MPELPVPPPRPDAPRPAEPEDEGYIIEARMTVMVVVGPDGHRDAVLAMPAGQAVDLVTLTGALERVKLLLQQQFRAEE